MNWHDVWQVTGIYVLSTVKFGFGGVPAAVFANFPFFKAVTITTAGGITGSILFANISEWVIVHWNKFRDKYIPSKRKNKKNILESKFVQNIKNKWGLAGIAFFTPFILSIPVGTFLAVRFFPDKQKVISYMLISITLWDILLYFLYHKFYNLLLPIFHPHH
jgi:hypothetical protein